MSEPLLKGSCIAPAITESDLLDYEALAMEAEGEVKLTMLQLIDCFKVWRATGHTNVPNKLYLDNCDLLFDMLTGDLRNAAFHLLWYAKELSLGREPATKTS